MASASSFSLRRNDGGKFRALHFAAPLWLLALGACQQALGPVAAPDEGMDDSIGPPPPIADFILVDKSDRTLTLFTGGQPTKTYHKIAFGDVPFGHKQFEGDERTPEGRYIIDTRNPNSAYHLSLRISYPNDRDRAFAEAQGRSPGGDIFIHGQPNSMGSNSMGPNSMGNAYPQSRISGDWTDGCIAVSNAEIEQLWNAVPDGTPIEIRQ